MEGRKSRTHGGKVHLLAGPSAAAPSAVALPALLVDHEAAGLTGIDMFLVLSAFNSAHQRRKYLLEVLLLVADREEGGHEDHREGHREGRREEGLSADLLLVEALLVAGLTERKKNKLRKLWRNNKKS